MATPAMATQGTVAAMAEAATIATIRARCSDWAVTTAVIPDLMLIVTTIVTATPPRTVPLGTSVTLDTAGAATALLS